MGNQILFRLPAKVFLVTAWLTLCGPSLQARGQSASTVVSPRQHFGFELGEDRKLADWNELTNYFYLLGKQSDRLKVQELGKTTEGRPFC